MKKHIFNITLIVIAGGIIAIGIDRYFKGEWGYSIIAGIFTAIILLIAFRNV